MPEKPSYPVYRYAFKAWCGRVNEPVSEILIGEVESQKLKDAVVKARNQVRAVAARYPRSLKLSRGQFVRMS